jgi:hypothetical protein
MEVVKDITQEERRRRAKKHYGTLIATGKMSKFDRMVLQYLIDHCPVTMVEGREYLKERYSLPSDSCVTGPWRRLETDHVIESVGLVPHPLVPLAEPVESYDFTGYPRIRTKNVRQKVYIAYSPKMQKEYADIEDLPQLHFCSDEKRKAEEVVNSLRTDYDPDAVLVEAETFWIIRKDTLAVPWWLTGTADASVAKRE